MPSVQISSEVTDTNLEGNSFPFARFLPDLLDKSVFSVVTVQSVDGLDLGKINLETLPTQRRSNIVSVARGVIWSDKSSVNEPGLLKELPRLKQKFLPRDSQEADKSGEIIFGSIDLKGNNFENPRLVDHVGAEEFRVLGLFDAKYLRHGLMAGELLRRLGVETEKIELALFPNELIYEGKKITIEDFKIQLLSGYTGTRKYEAEKFIKKFRPVIIVRSLQVPERIADVCQTDSEGEFLQMMQRVFTFVNAREEKLAERQNRMPRIFGVDKPQDIFDYFTEYLPSRIGENLALLHGAGLTHKFLHIQNISMVGSLYDLDSIRGSSEWGDKPSSNTEVAVDLSYALRELDRSDLYDGIFKGNRKKWLNFLRGDKGREKFFENFRLAYFRKLATVQDNPQFPKSKSILATNVLDNVLREALGNSDSVAQ